jgi:hypothetical protein
MCFLFFGKIKLYVIVSFGCDDGMPGERDKKKRRKLPACIRQLKSEYEKLLYRGLCPAS